MHLYRLWFAIPLLCLAWPATAAPLGKMAVPAAIPGVTTLNAERLIELVERLPGLVLIDSRVPVDRRQGYIQGSVSLPDTQTACATLGDVLASPNTPVMFYCNGVKCGRSVIAVKIAKGCGYKKLYWLRGGFEEWKQKGYPFLQQ
jgi:rhodanese-related sulfurtransferase